MALRPCDLDQKQCLIMLREKGGTVRWQPVSPTLMAQLLQLAEERHAPRTGQLRRYRNWKLITRRRYDHLWVRVGELLPWAYAQQISTHWLRDTTVTWVERNFGSGLARASAGHAEAGGDVRMPAVAAVPGAPGPRAGPGRGESLQVAGAFAAGQPDRVRRWAWNDRDQSIPVAVALRASPTYSPGGRDG
jgi:hypothetical protein